LSYDTNISQIFQCDIIIDKTKLEYLKKMIADGQITADHYSIKEDYVRIILKQSEINLLEQNGFKIKIKANM
jgi:hypothetical protein